MSLQNLVPPYLDALIQKLLSLLQNGQKVVQEGALTAMASVADCAKDSFAKYYTEVSRSATLRHQACLVDSHMSMHEAWLHCPWQVDHRCIN